MECPKCGGPAYDNREKVANGWKGPLAKCKDQDGCGWKKWAPKGQGGGNGAGPRNGGGNGRSAPTRPLGPLYLACMEIAAETVKRHVPNAAPSDIVAACATLFIGATNTGARLRPEPPKPKPEPEPEEEYSDEGGY